MRVLRRRAAAMSPREKHLAILSALGVVSLALYSIPTFLCATLILVVCCIVCYYHSGEPLPARLGLNPRAGVKVPAVLRRWLWGWGVTGVSVAARGRRKSGRNRNELAEAEGNFRGRVVETGVYRRETLASDSFLFSPRDFLMGSYIGKPESPTADSGRPRSGRNPREQLREKLSRPNHAVYTPNRRLSFAGEPPGTVGRFHITPQRHYPLQQPGLSSVGVLPPVKWDGFMKKNIRSPRNSSAVLSPVTVKIARPDYHSSPGLDHLTCAGLPRPPVDPCSRESVLKVLKDSRKREVEDEDRSFASEQKSKRRRNDSGGSAHSAFEPLLPNGMPLQLVPKPGNLKRGMALLAEDSIMKRSRTSSISSGSGVHAPRGTPGTMRNPIQSSYSSSLGLSQWKKRSAPSSPLSSPGSSRSQTPEGASKRAREDDGQSPSTASSVRSDQTASDKAPVTSKLTPVPKVPVTTSTDSTGSGGKRKRKIQLVSSHRDDHISLPPPPELGYSITVKDLDEEKKAALSKIQKVLETPAPEPEKSVSPLATTSTKPSSSTSSSTTTLSSLLAAPLPTASSSAIPVINLDPSPGSSVGTAPAASNPLLEALKMKISIPASSTSGANTTTVSASTTPVQPSSLTLKVSTSVVAPQLPPASQSQSSSAGVEQPSAFTQVLGQLSKASSSNPPAAGTSMFGLSSQMSTPTASSASNPVTATATAPASSSGSVSYTNPLLASGFKPIFSVSSTTSSATLAPDSRPPAQNFKPIFGAATASAGFGPPPPYTTSNSASTICSSSSSSMFGSTSSTTVTPSVFPGMTNTLTGTASITSTQSASQPDVKSLFGNWSAPSTTNTSSASAQAPNTGSTFQFGTGTTTTAAAVAPAAAPAAATTTSSNSTFAFGATQPDPQAANQKVFAFGHAAPSQNTTTASFGGFAMANTASTTAAATTQSTFTFGKSSFQTPAAQSNFGSSVATAAPSTFGSSVATAAPSTFGSSAATAVASTFGSSVAAAATFGSAAAAQSTFGSSAATAAQSTFGSSAATAAQSPFGSSAATAAQSTFGSSTAAQSTFGSSTAAQSTFGSSTAAQSTFGSSAATQSTFGSSAATAKPFTFGGSGASSSTPASNTAPPPFPFGSAAVTTAAGFGTPAKPAFGASSTGFAFGGTSGPTAAPSAAPSFGAATQTQSSSSATFAFGSAAPQQVPSGPAPSAPSGFNFGAGIPCPQFGTPVANNPAPQMGSFNFGAAATDKPAFGTSTPSFGQSAAAAGPLPFGSPGTPAQGFNAVPFGSPATPSFSIGAGSKPSGARQRLQARRQHTRKK
ncbi:nuclear envelope pore membrane protein POM 121 isoform X2 [Etheostoma cragini]|uniref:nuclear envelope pore membrane protein POM 121 isoform X2 n=1 Tax=Etheostoma cragini TaxID=417921 RepID=UPI00155E2B33|nr:nuclear envelope pore membrane protein POM 121 isoform X2 [Etheostoma cragini]